MLTGNADEVSDEVASTSSRNNQYSGLKEVVCRFACANTTGSGAGACAPDTKPGEMALMK